MLWNFRKFFDILGINCFSKNAMLPYTTKFALPPLATPLGPCNPPNNTKARVSNQHFFPKKMFPIYGTCYNSFSWTKMSLTKENNIYFRSNKCDMCSILSWRWKCRKMCAFWAEKALKYAVLKLKLVRVVWQWRKSAVLDWNSTKY